MPCRGHAICQQRGESHVDECYFDSKVPIVTHVLEKLEEEIESALPKIKQLREDLTGRNTNTPNGIRNLTYELNDAINRLVARSNTAREHVWTLQNKIGDHIGTAGASDHSSSESSSSDDE